MFLEGNFSQPNLEPPPAESVSLWGISRYPTIIVADLTVESFHHVSLSAVKVPLRRIREQPRRFRGEARSQHLR